MRLLSEADVGRLIDCELGIECAETAYVQQALGPHELKGRLDLRRRSPRIGALVVAGLGDHDRLLVVKTNAHAWPPGQEIRVTRSLLVLWDTLQAKPIALFAAAVFNDHRTAAGFAAAAKVLAPPQASTLVVFGAGKLAMPSLTYLCTVRPIERAIIVGRDAMRAQRLAAQARLHPALRHVNVSAMDDAGRAAQQADILVSVTTSDTPVFPGSAVRDRALVILGGANRPDAREADDQLIRRAAIYTDDTEGALAQAGDLAIPIATGVIDERAIVGEIGSLIGRPTAIPRHDGVSVFKSIGIALQDLTLAQALLCRAQRENLGAMFDVEGTEHAGRAP
jgi:ornithine cyclodeaminase/alanine dehydrogenase-like protein (mu-crystallin family)